MAAVDFKCRILSYDFGLPGSSHDAYVLRTSQFFQQMNSGEALDRMWTDYSVRMEDTIIPPYFLGDAAFPLLPWLMKGYGRCEPAFDFWLSSSRMIVEKAFGILKNRFRLLLDCRIRVKMTDIAYHHVPAILAIHNFCINNADEFTENWNECYNHNIEHSLVLKI
jgi:hypothetical protein